MNPIAERCRTEVDELHRLFEAWFCGRLEPEGPGLERLEAVLAPDFHIVSPGGQLSTREDLLMAIGRACGSYRGKPFRIWVEGLHTRAVGTGLQLVTYSEWQERDGGTRGRRSSALLRERANAPNGLEWLHVHETWLPAAGD